MLVLSRKVGERIIFQLTEPLPAGTELDVMLVDVKSATTARLGATAPLSVKVLREELTQRDAAQEPTAA